VDKKVDDIEVHACGCACAFLFTMLAALALIAFFVRPG